MSLAVGNAGRWDVILCRVWLPRDRLLEEGVCMRHQSVSLIGDRTCQALRSHVLESQSPGARAKLPYPRDEAPLAQGEDPTGKGQIP